MLSVDALRTLLVSLEADNVERTESAAKADKIGEAICSFANDLAGRRGTGVLLIGARDDGSCAGLRVEEHHVQSILGFRDGRIVPIPSLTARREVIDGCELLVVEVQPSDNPPVKYKGRVCVRLGQRRSFATPDEERRLTEKRVWGNLSFDQQPVIGSTFEDVDLERFRTEYLPASIAPDVLGANHRDPIDQLKALRFASREGTPTAVCILVVGKNPRTWFPGSYVQFVRYDGPEVTDDIRDQREINGTLPDILRIIDETLKVNISVGAKLSESAETRFPSYPLVALQELCRNAIIHRNYASSNSPVRVVWFSDRVEISNPGGPYGQVTAENFGKPHATDYRNPAIAEALKNLGFAQRFGYGIQRARTALDRNGNPGLEFNTVENYVHVTIRQRS
jgi:ATP-dependent DNA helicase RecG